MHARARESGLSQLQAQIHERLSGGAEGGREGTRVVPLLINGDTVGLACADIDRIVAVGKIAAAPGAPAGVRGLIASAGVLYTLVDPGHLLTGEPTRLTLRSRAVCLNNVVPGANLAILVDRALDIASVAPSAAPPQNPLADGSAESESGPMQLSSARHFHRLACNLVGIADSA